MAPHLKFPPCKDQNRRSKRSTKWPTAQIFLIPLTLAVSLLHAPFVHSNHVTCMQLTIGTTTGDRTNTPKIIPKLTGPVSRNSIADPYLPALEEISIPSHPKKIDQKTFTKLVCEVNALANELHRLNHECHQGDVPLSPAERRQKTPKIPSKLRNFLRLNGVKVAGSVKDPAYCSSSVGF